MPLKLWGNAAAAVDAEVEGVAADVVAAVAVPGVAVAVVPGVVVVGVAGAFDNRIPRTGELREQLPAAQTGPLGLEDDLQPNQADDHQAEAAITTTTGVPVTGEMHVVTTIALEQ